jgi:hypothetical protein
MRDLSFLSFSPVPVRGRRDGWTPPLQLRFIVGLARGMGPAEAARSVGRSRQTAYALRERARGAGFACAWDAAVEFAREIRAAPKPLGFDGRAIDLVLVPRFYRGRLVGFVQREDLAGAMRRLGTLDRLAGRLEEMDPDRPAFDDLIARVGVGAAPEADEADPMSLAKAAPASVSAAFRLRQSGSDRLG